MVKKMKDHRSHIIEHAVDWFMRMREQRISQKDKQAFSNWLLESPAHIEEYLSVARMYGELEELDPNKEIDVEALTSDEEAGNVLPFEEETEKEIEGAEKDVAAGITSLRVKGWQSIAASILFFAMFMGLFWVNYDQGQHYATVVGEQRSIVLGDGSIIGLNTQSEVAVRMTNSSRVVDLLKGEAFFDIKRDVERPFIVNTGDAQVRVLGTKFNIYKQADQTAVTVLHGKVSVLPLVDDNLVGALSESSLAGLGSASVELVVGEQVQIVPEQGPVEKTVVNVNKVTAWQDRRLVFEAQPLLNIVEEFNRYNSQKIDVFDTELAELEISGVFESNDPDSLIDFLQRIRKVSVRTVDEGERRIIEAETKIL